MNSEIKQKWIEALESGEYTQITKRLRTDEGFCCLGVLCDIYSKSSDDPNKDWKIYNDYKPIDRYQFLDSNTALSQKVIEWAGLTEAARGGGYFGWDIKVTFGGERRYLAELNDDLLLNFKQIAEVIKEQL